MKSTFKLITFAVILLAVIITGCSSNSGDKGVKKLESLESERGNIVVTLEKKEKVKRMGPSSVNQMFMM